MSSSGEEKIFQGEDTPSTYIVIVLAVYDDKYLFYYFTFFYQIPYIGTFIHITLIYDDIHISYHIQGRI